MARLITCTICDASAEATGPRSDTCGPKCSRALATLRQRERRAAARRSKAVADHMAWLEQMLAEQWVEVAELVESAR